MYAFPLLFGFPLLSYMEMRIPGSLEEYAPGKLTKLEPVLVPEPVMRILVSGKCHVLLNTERHSTYCAHSM